MFRLTVERQDRRKIEISGAEPNVDHARNHAENCWSLNQTAVTTPKTFEVDRATESNLAIAKKRGPQCWVASGATVTETARPAKNDWHSSR